MTEISDDGLAWNTRNYKELIINVALTGAVPQKSEHANLPTSPSEIADDVEECAQLGAQVFHLHMRDSEGLPTQSQRLFIQTINEIRERNPKILLCVTTSSRAGASFEERIAPLGLPVSPAPELASLSMGSFNFPSTISKNPPNEILELANIMRENSIKPELEVFEPGMLSSAILLHKKGILSGPLVVNILLGNHGTSQLTAQGLSPFLSQLPESSEWALAGIGRFQRKAILMGVALGGNVRVGMEDDPVGDGGGSWSNSKAVSLAIESARLAGRGLASCESVRQRFGLLPANR